MLRIEGLQKTFAAASAPSVGGLSLHVPEGSFFTLLGPSGCGKTTTLRCVAGLEQPDAGEIWIGGERVFSSEARRSVPAHKRDVGMVFQSYAIWPHMTVLENVAYPLKNLGKSREETSRAVGEALDLVGLGHLAHRPAPLLSGGEQQRVALARALVGRPRILLLDEPLSNLDSRLRDQMRFELRDLQQRLGVTAIYVTHDQDEAFALSDLMAVMRLGEIVELGRPEEIYEAPETAFGAEFLGGGVPLDGHVSHVGGPGRVRVDTSVGPIACRCRAPLAQGQSVRVYVRAEDLEVVYGEDPLGGPSFEAVVDRVVFLGGDVEWRLRGLGWRGRSRITSQEGEYVRTRAGGTIQVRVLAARCVPTGVTWNPENPRIPTATAAAGSVS